MSLQENFKTGCLLLALASLLTGCATSEEYMPTDEQEPPLLFLLERRGPSLTALGRREPIERFSIPGDSSHLALSPSGSIGAISLCEEGRIQLFDIVRMRLGQQIELGRDSKPTDLKFIDEQRLLIGSKEDGVVSLYHSAFGHAHHQLDSGGHSATQLELDLETSTFWVLDSASGKIARMSWERSRVQRSAQLAETLDGLFHNKRGGEVWALSADADLLFVLDERDLSLKRELSCPGRPVSLAFDHSGDAWVACQDSSAVVKIDTETGAVKASIAIPFSHDGAPPVPTQLLIDQEALLVHVVCPGSDSIQVIDMEINRCVADVSNLRSPVELTKSRLAIR